MDLIATAPRLPRAGESLLGANFIAIPGGKAGNQAVAAARHGAQTAIVARVGNDAFGDELRQALDRKGVSVGLLQTDENEATGVS
ncbi:MAG: ribokinase, partial [Chloroflexia bacterium]|nr:ribokinase [Chloroflexia bacterium]